MEIAALVMTTPVQAQDGGVCRGPAPRARFGRVARSNLDRQALRRLANVAECLPQSGDDRVANQLVGRAEPAGRIAPVTDVAAERRNKRVNRVLLLRGNA